MARRGRNPNTGVNILVVDDKEEVLISVSRLLRREGHRVITAQSAERALELFRSQRVHLLLVDYFMPRMTGEDLVREIRKIDPFVPIVLQTGYSGEKPPREMIRDLDIQGYHDKSEGPERLLVWVQSAFRACEHITHLGGPESSSEELVADVSHELRNPLNVIAGYTELLLDGSFGSIPAEAELPLRALAGTAENLNELVSNFLVYTRLQRHSIEASPEWVDIEELAGELQRLATLLLQRSGVCFVLDLERAPARVLTDPMMLRTILRNLVSNAAKFTEQGTVTVRIAAGERHVLFAVTDTGFGIRPGELEGLFEPFDGFAFHEREHAGIGLGLALCRVLAGQLGGRLEAHSDLPRGSTFTLRLPAVDAAGSRLVDQPLRLPPADLPRC
jgi:signal transduction histidine kinase